MRHLTLGYLTLNASPLDTVHAAAAAGFKSVGLRIATRRIHEHQPPEFDFGRMTDEVKSSLDRTGIRLASVAGYHLYPDVDLTHLESMVEVSAALGADYILTMSYQPDQKKFEYLFSKYCEYAEKRGLIVALEFSRYSEVKTLTQSSELLHGLGLPNARLVIDALHLFRSGGTEKELGDAMLDDVICLQLSDALHLDADMTDEELIQEARHSRLAPGDGELPLKDLVGKFPPDLEIEYEAPISGAGNLSFEQQAMFAHQRLEEFLR